MGWYYDTLYWDRELPHVKLKRGEEPFQTTNLVGFVTPPDTMQLHHYRLCNNGRLVLEKIHGTDVLIKPLEVPYTGKLHFGIPIFKGNKRSGDSLADLEEDVNFEAVFEKDVLQSVRLCSAADCNSNSSYYRRPSTYQKELSHTLGTNLEGSPPPV